MSKNFFIIVPYTPLNLEVKGISRIMKSREQKSTGSPDKFFEDRTQLEQRISIIEQGLSRIGIRTALLGTEELVELYYHIFNPEDMSSAPKR